MAKNHEKANRCFSRARCFKNHNPCYMMIALAKNNKSVIVHRDFLYKNMMHVPWNGFLMRGIVETEDSGTRKSRFKIAKIVTKKQGAQERTVFFFDD